MLNNFESYFQCPTVDFFFPVSSRNFRFESAFFSLPYFIIEGFTFELTC